MQLKKLKLSTPAEVRAAMSRIANAVFNGEIESKEANAIVYACNTILSSIRLDQQQKKLEELERLLDSQKEQSYDQ